MFTPQDFFASVVVPAGDYKVKVPKSMTRLTEHGFDVPIASGWFDITIPGGLPVLVFDYEGWGVED